METNWDESDFLNEKGDGAGPNLLDAAARFAGTPQATNKWAQRKAAKVAAPLVTCPRCGGTGTWRGFGDCVGNRMCLKCNGSGKVKGLLMDDASVKRRTEAKARKERKAAEAKAAHEAAIQSWRAAHSAAAAWIDRNDGRFDFATAMTDALNRYASLTEGQLAAIERCIARDAERAAARDASATSIAGEGFTKLLAAFAAAKANKLKYPKVRIDTLAFSLAGDNSANRGCVYVKAGETYLGKITAEGKLFASRDCDASNRALIEQVGRDPLAAAVAHGHKTGNCAMCGRELTDPDSVARGIGPICADNFGL